MTQSFHPPELRRNALTLLRNGASNTAVAARIKLPLGTIGYWKHLDRARHPALYPPAAWASCPMCFGLELHESHYSYLLGLYLGDGHIIHKYKQHTLTISCADAWPGLMDAAEEAIRRVMPGAKYARIQRTGCTSVTSYSGHWVCLFPQHGPGRKHERSIRLVGWQAGIVGRFPKEFIRGLIHSDGCRVANWTRRLVAGEMKRYEYPRYHFTNESADIRNLYTGTLDALGIEWRYNDRNTISVAKRDSVAAMDEFVGPKY